MTALQSEQLLVSAFHLFGASAVADCDGSSSRDAGQGLHGRVLVQAATVIFPPLRASTPLTGPPRPTPLAVPAGRTNLGATSGPRTTGAHQVTTRAASICGIDLGTTNSAVAVVVDGKPIIVADKDGNRTVPSVVSFAHDGTVLVGHDARRRLAKDPANTFSSVKRFIGKSFDSKTVKDDAKRVPYEVVAAPDGVGVALRSPAAGRDVTPIEVSQHIIATMLRSSGGRDGRAERKHQARGGHRPGVLRRRAVRRDDRGWPRRGAGEGQAAARARRRGACVRGGRGTFILTLVWAIS